MKTKRIFIAGAIAFAAICLTVCGCDRKVPSADTGGGVDVLNHVCEQACADCGGCLSKCIHPVCSNNRCSCNVKQCEHSYTVWEIEKKPTLGTEGRATSHCSECGEPSAFVIPVLGDGEYYTKTLDSSGAVATYSYNNTELGIMFSSSVSVYPENAETYVFECEEMTLIGKAKTAVDDSGEGYIGWMSGANQVGNGFTFSIDADADGSALLIVGVGLRAREEVPFNATYSFTVSYGGVAAEDVPVDDGFIFPKSKIDATDWTELEVVTVRLKAGKNVFTVIHDTDKAGVNWNYFKFVSDVGLAVSEK